MHNNKGCFVSEQILRLLCNTEGSQEDIQDNKIQVVDSSRYPMQRDLHCFGQ